MKTLQAGSISAKYDNGFLRRISYGESEVLRMIYFAFRDHNWNTLGFSIENERISSNENEFLITYDYFNVDGGIDVMEWKAKVEGRPNGILIFEIQGTVLENFRKNRAGFCVLHPLNITNQECRITHADNTETTHLFPQNIAPENPFKNIRSMNWKTSDIPFSLSFEGDIFETEDQRNWGDASFKTFCTPLDQPFPVDLKKGQKVFQRITFKPESLLQPLKKEAPYISLRDVGAGSILPTFGTGASSEIHPMPSRAVDMIKSLKLGHYRIEIYPDNDNWVTLFSQDYENAYTLGLPLEVALHLTDNYHEETEAFVLLCQQNKVKVKKVLLLQGNGIITRQEVIKQVSTLKASLPKVSFGAGTNYNFNELNKNRFSPGDLDFISFSIDPQEHAFDNLTILENIETQEHLVNSTKSIYGNAHEVHVSPITLRKRFNPYATNPADLVIAESLKADPRQKEVFAAIWTFGSICSLAKAGAQTLTYFQTIGNQGILSEQGDPYPVYNTLKSFSSFQGKRVNIPESSDPLTVQAIILDDKVLAMVNLTEQETAVRMHNRSFSLGPHEIRFESLHHT